jgi:hypothetical protein
MIVITPTASSLSTRDYLATKELFEARKTPVVEGGQCCLFGCGWSLPAIANPTDPTDNDTNDKVDFILDIPLGATVTANLVKIDGNGNETEYLINNDTYGQFYATGTIKANVWGFILDFYKVYNTLGYGEYKVNIQIDSFSGQDIYDKDSPCYRLVPYDCYEAHNTVRIQSWQTGYFEGGFDYTGISYVFGEGLTANRGKSKWFQQMRVYGRFWRSGRDYIVDNIVTKLRGQEQVQSQTIKVYNLQLDNIKSDQSNKLIDDMLMANEVYISDYNSDSVEDYKNVRVSMTDIGDPESEAMNTFEQYTITLREYFQDNIHRFE